MNITTWPIRALFKYVYQRVLGTFIRTDLDLNDIDFSAKSFAISDIELNTFEINKMLQSGEEVLPFKLVSATVKSIDIPWGIFKLGQGVIELQGVDVILMPCGTRKKSRRRSKEDAWEGEKDEEVEEVSISTTIVTKFLSNVGIIVRDIAVKIVPWEFGQEEKLQESPTLMLRLNHLYFIRSQIEKSEPLEESADIGEEEDSVMNSTIHEKPIPHILMVLKSKILKVGQISLHLLSSPFGSERDQNNSKFEGMEFPYSFPPVNHLTTLLCIGNPDEPSASCFELSMTQSESDKKLFKIKSKITWVESIIDPLQLWTINSILKKIKYANSKEWYDESLANSIDQLSKSIFNDLNKGEEDEEYSSTLKEIKSFFSTQKEQKSLEDSQIQVPITSEITFKLRLKLQSLSVSLIHDWSNSSRNHDRIYDSFYWMKSNNPWGVKGQSDIFVGASHYLFEMKDLLLKGRVATKSKFNLKIQQVALYDYILQDWKLPSIKDLKSEVKTAGRMNNEYFSKNNEKELKRRSEIQKITKTTMRRSSSYRNPTKNNSKLRRSTGVFDRNHGWVDYPPEEPDQDPDEFMSAYEEEIKSNAPSEDAEKSICDSQSFKSFAMNMGNEGGSVVSSIHESAFGDAYDEADYWRLNHDREHFSLIPILTINSFKNISKSIRRRYDTVKLSSSLMSSREEKGSQEPLDSVNHQEDINFHFPHHFIDPDYLMIESDDESDEEKEVRLGDLKPPQETQTEITNAIELAIEVQRHWLEKTKRMVSLVDVDIRTQNIFIELTPWSILHGWSLLNPFGYLYNSSTDDFLSTYK